MSAAQSPLATQSSSAPVPLKGRDPWPWRCRPLFPFPPVKDSSTASAPQTITLAPLLSTMCRRGSADSFESTAPSVREPHERS
ncbi:uncharacterized protein RHOBADRAFT_65889 [Rhodotorula graminis WP1]|uniref:Uncharacterized protein n=1 Tax=Rhodotorula graminis (strain WP1) TaxID=578459 RepID=A0A194SCV5_RHOGW|nr:uncharacterized protein RHOBADRAFT_65889 [Rhodotorula graminis WP1]KPV78275.1 hypothetical protein RHOBADRAFT_65889 [Rhodotorula graminis WP1]